MSKLLVKTHYQLYIIKFYFNCNFFYIVIFQYQIKPKCGPSTNTNCVTFNMRGMILLLFKWLAYKELLIHKLTSTMDLLNIYEPLKSFTWRLLYLLLIGYYKIYTLLTAMLFLFFMSNQVVFYILDWCGNFKEWKSWDWEYRGRISCLLILE